MNFIASDTNDFYLDSEETEYETANDDDDDYYENVSILPITFMNLKKYFFQITKNISFLNK